MPNLIYFSDYFGPITGKLKFALVVVVRFLKMLFRRRKRIKLLRLEYSRKYVFDNSFLIIKYRFRNALWYKFGNLKTTTENHVVVFNVKKIDTSDITFTVYGLFQKKVYHLSVLPENVFKKQRVTATFNSQKFIPTLSGIIKRSLSIPFLKVEVLKPIPTIPDMRIKKTSLRINKSSYTQTDFL